MVRQSLWQNDMQFPSFAQLDCGLPTDMLMICSGIAGILDATLFPIP